MTADVVQCVYLYLTCRRSKPFMTACCPRAEKCTYCCANAWRERITSIARSILG